MDEIEARAQLLLEELPDYIWHRGRPPIPIEEIADSHFGLHVCDVAPERMRSAPGCPELREGETLSGLLLPTRGEIWVNADEAVQWPPRRRFTIAHELGHHVLHTTGQQALFCRHGVVDPDEEPRVKRPLLPLPEREANAFAAALLMPAEMIEHYYERTDGNFTRLCRIFEVSGAAMGRRLRAVIPG